ncbi:hypothetical protein ANCCAN_23162 [Ancylostoma caninum]|uniref:glucuronosyltransferase n=1 Tax=Ancylostoma caninum TaxID=29170 RepID=A0A368FG74_ANCCA|nr:hypothetical protein ANCCAN_23162 [Ancylostoma caninum]
MMRKQQGCNSGAMRRLHKTELSLTDCFRYGKNAKKLARMVRNKPVSPKDLLIRWTEFLAEFKTLENLTPAGNKLNWIQYHSIDVLLFLASLISVVIVVSYKISRFVVMWFCSALKNK